MNPSSIVTLLHWSVPACFGLHIIEELFWPGGFREWYHGYRPQVAGATMGYYYKANAVYFTATLLTAFGGPASMLFAAGVLFNNLLFTHVKGTLATRKYSPGIVTGALLYVPMFASCYGYVLTQHLMSLPLALSCYALSFSSEIYFALKKVAPTAKAA